MKTTEQRSKTTTVASTKAKAVTGLGCSKSGISTNKTAKQRWKTAGNALVSLESEQSEQMKPSNTNQRSHDELPNKSFFSKGENHREFSGQPLPSSTQPLSSVVPTCVPRESSQCFQKFKLQLFPIDEVTCKGLEMVNSRLRKDVRSEKHNPYLELTLGTRKKISSVVKHLNVKWRNSKVTSGELMLFPYHARLENLASHRRWTLKDSDTSVADVHAAIGSPAVFRLRYGWFSDLELKNCGMPLISLLSEDNLHTKENQRRNIADEEKYPCPIESQGHGPAPVDDSLNQGVGKPIPLDKSVQAADNRRTGNRAVLLWDLSNISFGALLSEASANANANPISCDSFDAAIARYQTTNQSTPVSQSSIWDAEETCNAFSFQRITSSSKTVPPQSKDASITSCTQNVSSNPLRLHDALGPQVGHTKEDASEEPRVNLHLHTKGESCSQAMVDSQPHTLDVVVDTLDVVVEEPKAQLHTEASHNDNNHLGKLDIYWPESLGPLEYAAPSSKQIIGGDSVGLGGLIASSLDAFQNFSIF